MKKAECRTYFSFVLSSDGEEAAKAIKDELGVTPELRHRRLIVGLNEDYDVDVNKMLRVTLKDLFGKEEKIKELQKRFSLTTSLEVVPYIKTRSKQPHQYLSPESDIIEFLYKSRTALDLDYYLI